MSMLLVNWNKSYPLTPSIQVEYPAEPKHAKGFATCHDLFKKPTAGKPLTPLPCSAAWRGIFTEGFVIDAYHTAADARDAFKRRMKFNMRDQRRNTRYYGTSFNSLQRQREHNKKLADLVATFARNRDDMEALERLRQLRVQIYCDPIREKFPELELHMKQRNRISCGEWKNVPWKTESWALTPRMLSMNAHVSESDSTMLAYTQSVDKLKRDIQTKIRPGRFLKKYLPEMPDEEVRDWVSRWEAANKPFELEFIDNKSGSKWVEAYAWGVQASSSNYESCMTGETCVKVYAHPGNDLTLIVVRADVNGTMRVVARTIGNVKTKRYVRTYTDSHVISYTAFEHMLEAAGWKLDAECLEGQKLRVIREGSKIVCPYIDGDYQCVEDYGDFLVISEDGIEATNTGGYIDDDDDDEDMETCDFCDGRYHESDMNYGHNSDHVCDSCLSEHFVEAYARYDYREWCRQRQCVRVDDEWYHEDFLDRHDICYCSESGEYHSDDDMVWLACGSFVYAGLGSIVKLDVTSRAEDAEWAFECDTETLDDGRVVYDADVKELSDGRLVHCNDYDEMQDELDAAEAEQDELLEDALTLACSSVVPVVTVATV